MQSYFFLMFWSVEKLKWQYVLYALRKMSKSHRVSLICPKFSVIFWQIRHFAPTHNSIELIRRYWIFCSILLIYRFIGVKVLQWYNKKHYKEHIAWFTNKNWRYLLFSKGLCCGLHIFCGVSILSGHLLSNAWLSPGYQITTSQQVCMQEQLCRLRDSQTQWLKYLA